MGPNACTGPTFSSAGSVKRCISVCLRSRRPNTKRLSPPPQSMSQSMPFGSLHLPTLVPSSELKASTVPEPLRNATTRPFGNTWSEPLPTVLSRCCIARSGMSMLLSFWEPLSCTILPEVVPTTTQPTSPEGAASPLSRHSLLTAKDSTFSCAAFFSLLWSQSLDMVQVTSDLKACAGASCFESSAAASAASGKGHCASLRPRACSTTTRQVGLLGPSVQTTPMSLRACPSSAVQGGKCWKTTPSTCRGTRRPPPTLTSGPSSNVRAADATAARVVVGSASLATSHESRPL
mmetsp:Transcript_91699/g.213281  ORF Transcript_91699/g.213281 Transcript_91699/m.213281 type:complete len:291 (+) Transcript_91699:84-956(+)